MSENKVDAALGGTAYREWIATRDRPPPGASLQMRVNFNHQQVTDLSARVQDIRLVQDMLRALEQTNVNVRRRR